MASQPSSRFQSIPQQIATELGVQSRQVSAAIALIDDGNTVPFIARYRKEVTGGLDDTQLRTLDSRLSYLRDLDDRRQTILNSIREQGKLTDSLEHELLQADSKTRLEDLYLPYKPKRRTKGQIAIEAGLEPLADILWSQAAKNPEQEARAFINPSLGIESEKHALDGARAIIIDRITEEAGLLQILREELKQQGLLVASLVKGKDKEGEKFKDYFDHREAIAKVPSHRALAMLRGRNEGILQLAIKTDAEEKNGHSAFCESRMASYFNKPASDNSWIYQTICAAWRTRISGSMETELLSAMKESAEAQAIDVFAHNLKDLLMAAPAGPRATLGFDPGLRTGSKLAVIDTTGKVLATTTIYPLPPQNQTEKSASTICDLVKRYQVDLIAIGNGTGSREADAFVASVIKDNGLQVQKITVSEAGASVYSASELAAKEFPDLDVSLRGAVSIARRLQDPLAELVKIEPKSIGVGQYQHDVNQSHLMKQLDAVVEDCVNAVGVDVNMASSALLSRVAGLSPALAQNIVHFRDENGRFDNRQTLKKVPRLGPKAFEQCAGFLRIMKGKNPLDASAVHPEAYSLVKQIAQQTGEPIQSFIGNQTLLRSLNAKDFTTPQFGLPTVTDILQELEKPGRDPRPEFKTAEFAEGVHTLSDLKEGMILEGVVSNVAQFGAFVDIGVHQDGLVHISALADRFVSDPRDIVKAGDVVRVKVLDVDIQRKRIALTMKLSDTPNSPSPSHKQPQKASATKPQRSSGRSDKPTQGTMGNALAAAFAKNQKRT